MELKQTATATRKPPNKRFEQWLCRPLQNKQRETTKFYVFWRTRTTAANFSYFHLEFNDVVTFLA